MAGGTGGHVFPALAIADYLRQRNVPLFWLGTRLGIEARVVPEKGYQLATIHISGLRGKGLLRWIQAPVVLLIALAQSMLILMHIKPAVVLGMGGFVSGPGGIAACLMRIPLCIHEQNAIAGLTNRILAPMARRVMQAFPDTFPVVRNAHTTGNPVRTEIEGILPPAQRIRIDGILPLRILVLGGSQGARRLNRVVPETLSRLPRDMYFEIRHQTGEKYSSETMAFYQALNLKVQLEPFINNIAEAYAWADLVICRSGALTIAELSAAGVASILVPFPFAVDDHQTANARYLVDHGAAVLLPEKDLSEENLGRLIRNFYRSRQRLLDMAQNARAQARPQAASKVAELCLETAYAG